MKRASFYHSISVCNRGTDHRKLGQQGKKISEYYCIIFFWLEMYIYASVRERIESSPKRPTRSTAFKFER